MIADKVWGIRNIFNRHAQEQDEAFEEFWALKDVSFEIKQGDRVGIIGRNGAGKSTLLKVLSQITEPTSGKISIKGRVASLLEVGTGFHPELTGRENIFLNGAILGMDRFEIKKKFDEIVAFAEVEKFLDTPVKRYSSGMYVRLAFAVAAHLEPEILIVDEVLAVGDAAFQKKCLGKMEDVAQNEGRTVLFVSHNMAAIQNLCQRAIWLNQGQLIIDNQTQIVINDYLSTSTNFSNISLANRKDRQGDGKVRFTFVQFENEEGIVHSFYSGQKAKIILFFENKTNQNLKNFNIALGIDNQMGERITHLSTEIRGTNLDNISCDVNYVTIELDKLPFTSGRYSFTVFSTVNGVIADWIQNAGFFEVEPGDFYGTGKIPETTQGSFLIDYQFQIPCLNS
nr:ABC transporter ATP-binding protein [Pseudanabaena mucicola]